MYASNNNNNNSPLFKHDLVKSNRFACGFVYLAKSLRITEIYTVMINLIRIHALTLGRPRITPTKDQPKMTMAAIDDVYQARLDYGVTD